MKFRKVSLYDDLRQVAHLLYHANVPAHRAWRGNETNFVEFIQPWLCAQDFLYYYKNLHIATEDQDHYPLAIVGGLEPTSTTGAANFHYEIFDDDDSKFIIKNYIADIVGWQKFLSPHELLLTVFCTDPSLHDDDIGYDLLMHYVYKMRSRGYTSFRINCDADDRIALQKYEKLGFLRIGESSNPADPENTSARLANFALRF